MLVDGRPASGAKLYTYATGTSTPKATYSDAALTVANANPIVADSAGAFGDIFPESGTYRVVLEDADGNVLFTADDVDGAGSSASAAAASAGMKNRIVNGSMVVVQKFGTANTDVTTGAVYTLDQWVAALSAAPGGTLRVAQNATTSLQGSPFRLRATVQASDGTLAAGDFYGIEQYVEGRRSAPMRFGGVNARQVIVRFGVRSSVAGTFCLSASNSALNRSYIATYVIAAGEVNTDVEREIVIPGDASGTWLTDEGVGIRLRWSLGAGTTFQGVTGWQAGDLRATSTQLNLMATGSATFDLFDVGFYVDTQAIGTAPTYELPTISDELNDAQRYYEIVSHYAAGSGTAADVYSATAYCRVYKRATSPAVGQFASIATANVSARAVGSLSNHSAEISATLAANGAWFDHNRWEFDARL